MNTQRMTLLMQQRLQSGENPYTLVIGSNVQPEETAKALLRLAEAGYAQSIIGTTKALQAFWEEIHIHIRRTLSQGYGTPDWMRKMRLIGLKGISRRLYDPDLIVLGPDPDASEDDRLFSQVGARRVMEAAIHIVAAEPLSRDHPLVVAQNLRSGYTIQADPANFLQEVMSRLLTI